MKILKKTWEIPKKMGFFQPWDSQTKLGENTEFPKILCFFQQWSFQKLYPKEDTGNPKKSGCFSAVGFPKKMGKT